MLALRYYGQRDIRLKDIDLPEIKNNEVLVKITDAGISQTQVNEFIEGPFIINKTPFTPCQEFGGVVEKVANKENSSLLNKMVAVLPLVACGKCEYCKRGNEQLCNELTYHGLLGLDGGFAEYCAVNKENLFFVEKQELLTFIEPILVGIHSAYQYLKFDDIESKNVLVLGAGAVGISVASVWRDYFKANIVISEFLQKRAKRAKECGFSVLKQKELKQKFDIVIDAAGMDAMADTPAFKEGFGYLKKGGTLLNIGTYFHPLEIVPSEILISEHSVITSIMYNSKDVEVLGDVVKSLKVDFSKFIKEIPLVDIIEDGYYAIEIDKEDFVRIVVKP